MFSWKYLVSGSSATPSVNLAPCSVPFPEMGEYAQNAVPLMMLKVCVKNTEDQKFYFCRSSESLPSVPGKYTRRFSITCASLYCKSWRQSRQNFLWREQHIRCLLANYSCSEFEAVQMWQLKSSFLFAAEDQRILLYDSEFYSEWLIAESPFCSTSIA